MTFDPITEVRNFSDRMQKILTGQLDTLRQTSRDFKDNVAGRVGGLDLSLSSSGANCPAVNVHEKGAAYRLEFALPGIRFEDIELSVLGRDVYIKGTYAVRCVTPSADSTKASPGQTASEETCHMSEWGTGTFERTITLPQAVDAGRVEAHLSEGILVVSLPKSVGEQPRRINVVKG